MPCARHIPQGTPRTGQDDQHIPKPTLRPTNTLGSQAHSSNKRTRVPPNLGSRCPHPCDPAIPGVTPTAVRTAPERTPDRTGLPVASGCGPSGRRPEAGVQGSFASAQRTPKRPSPRRMPDHRASPTNPSPRRMPTTGRARATGQPKNSAQVRNSRVQRVRRSENLNAVTQPGKVRVGVGDQYLGDDVSNLAEGCFAESARSQAPGCRSGGRR